MNEQMSLVRLTPEGELRSSTEVIAQGMAYQHASTIKLVRRYQAELEAFGPIRFEIRMGIRGGVPVEYADLNEQQAALLISFMRNNSHVVGFKVRLVSEFFKMREAMRNGFMNLWQQRIALEAESATSKAKGSIGSRLMHGRKKEIPVIDDKRKLLDAAMQPGLLN